MRAPVIKNVALLLCTHTHTRARAHTHTHTHTSSVSLHATDSRSHPWPCTCPRRAPAGPPAPPPPTPPCAFGTLAGSARAGAEGSPKRFLKSHAESFPSRSRPFFCAHAHVIPATFGARNGRWALFGTLRAVFAPFFVLFQMPAFAPDHFSLWCSSKKTKPWKSKLFLGEGCSKTQSN